MGLPTMQQIEDGAEWLAGCRGFRVVTPRGRLGFVEEVRRDPDSHRPEALVVRSGLARHRLVVPVDEIAGVVVSKAVVILQQAPPSAANGA
jgi:hypothetical protein